MCGRFAQIFPTEDLINFFEVTDSLPLQSRYNIAPTQNVAVIRATEHHRQLAILRWGLIPRWANDLSIGNKTFNARSETVHAKPSFKSALKSRRCLIPASGFYEWDKIGKSRQPYYFSRRDGQPIAFAGLWEEWTDCQSDGIIESCTILTTSANQTVGLIHERMPVIIGFNDYGLWLSHKVQRIEELRDLFRPAAENILRIVPVTTYVNKVGQEGPDCVAPVPAGGS